MVTRPDAPAGRGRHERRSPVAVLAGDAGIPVLTPARPREPDFLAALARAGAGLLPGGGVRGAGAAGRARHPRHGWVNLHFSLLPAWRGAAPVQAAVLHGDEVTGASTFQLEEGLDTGPVYGVVTEPVRPARHRRRPARPARPSPAPACWCATLDGIEDGTLVARAAAGRRGLPGAEVHRRGRARWTGRRRRSGWTGWSGPAPRRPGALDDVTGRTGSSSARCCRCRTGRRSAPGELLVERRRVLVGTGTHPVELGEVQPPGKRPMPAPDWARGARPAAGASARRHDRPSRRAGGAGAAAGRAAAPGPARPAPRRAADPARRVAYDLLRAVDERDAYANLTLPALLRERGLTGRDAALRHRARVRHAARGRHAGRVPGPLRRPADDGGRPGGPGGAAAGRVPAAADPGAAARRGFRDRGPGAAAARPGSSTRCCAGCPGRTGTRGSPRSRRPTSSAGWRCGTRTRRWIAAAFEDALGGDRAETEAALAADDARPQTHLVARPGRVDRDQLAAQAGGEPGPYSPYAVRLPAGGDPGALAAVRDGRAGVQDEGSQLCALALTRVPLDGPDARWLDLCAGPGGKAALLGSLAALRPGPAVRVTAVEVAPHRARLVAAATAGLPVDVVQADGTAPPWRPGWVRPGAGRRALHRARRAAAAPGGALAAQPGRPGRADRASSAPLLRRGIEAARPGGVVAYVVCSPHLAETRDVVAERAAPTAPPTCSTPARLPAARPGAGPRPALAAPARHRRDVLRPAAAPRSGRPAGR